MTVHVASMVEIINAYKILVGKPEQNKTLRRPSRRWERIIRMNHS